MNKTKETIFINIIENFFIEYNSYEVYIESSLNVECKHICYSVFMFK